MAAGISVAAANDLVDTFVAAGPLWVKLHLGDPGAAGTSNPAAETTRQQASLPAASGGASATDAALVWTAVAASETYRYASLWTDEVAGDFGGSGELDDPVSVTEGDRFTISTGDLAVALGTVAA